MSGLNGTEFGDKGSLGIVAGVRKWYPVTTNAPFRVVSLLELLCTNLQDLFIV